MKIYKKLSSQKTNSIALAFLFINLINISFCLASDNESHSLSVDSEKIYRFWRGGSSPGRLVFEDRLVQRIFDITSDKFGMAAVQNVNEPLSAYRSRLSLAEGTYIHFHIGVPLIGYEDTQHITIIDKPIFKNLMGYRKLIVRKNDLDSFLNIGTFEDLKEKTAGLGHGWPDIEIMENNGFNVTVSSNFDNLFPMLLASRFDFLPLGAAEVENSIPREYLGQLAIVPNLTIYYPWTLYFIISNKHTELIERLKFGLKILEESNELSTIFNELFQSEIDKINTPNTKVTVLKVDVNGKTRADTVPYLIPDAKILD